MPLISKVNDVHFFHCCKCSKTVDKVESYRDLATSSVEFIVYCHGDKESATLPDYILYDTIDIVEAKCFKRERLTNDNSN
jgi:hypothetical protein